MELFHTHVGRWTLELNQRLIRFAMTLNPQDWYLIADGDEFQVYDRPLPDLIETCERLGAHHASGCFLDRVGPDGELAEIGAASLWKQFPLGGAISVGVLRALPLKVTLARGHVRLSTGQHGVVEGRGLSPSECFAQIHHFKWTKSVVDRLNDRIMRFQKLRAGPGYESIIWESLQFMSYLREHGGRLDATDARFMLHECGNRFADHPQWNSMARDALQWRWATG